MTFQSIGEAAAKVVDVWAWWRAALANPAEIGKSIAIHIQPEQGYYRVRGKNGQWQPVAIWKEDGEWLAYRAGREVKDVEQLWTYACRHPIEHAAYEKAMAGEPFDDEPPAPTIGDNSGDVDPFEALRLEYLGEKEQAEEFLKKGIKTQDEADKASIWKDRILKIRSRAQAMFKAEKAPVLAEERRIDEKYRELAHEKDGDTTAMIEKLRLGMDGFMRAQKRAEEERQRKAREEADRIRREAEEAARKAEEAAKVALQTDNGVGSLLEAEANAEADRLEDERKRLAEAAAQAEKDAEARKVTAGRTGARTTMRTVKVGVVTDYAKAAAALVAMKHPDMIAEIDRLAKNAATKNFPFDGMEIREEEKVV